MFHYLFDIQKFFSRLSYQIFKKIHSTLCKKPKLLFGQTVLITGGGSGIGKLLAKKLAEEHHCRVVIWDIDYEKAVETCREIKSNFISAYKVDISNRNEVYNTANQVRKDVGNVTILINNAAIVPPRSFFDPESKDEDRIKTIEVNVLGNMWMCKAFLPQMLANKRGHLVTIGSAAGMVGSKGLAEYCASKFACIGFHESIQSEIYALGLQDYVKTTLINPYYINTGMFHGVSTKNHYLLSILNEDDVVDKITIAILYEREILNIPSLINFIPLFKFLPPSLYYTIMDYFGIKDSMKNFKKIRKY